MSEWTVTKEALEGACKILSNVPPRNGIKASEYIKISAHGKDSVTLTLTSDLAARALIRTGAKFPFPDDLYVDRRLFMPFVEKGAESKTTSYVFTQKKNGLIVVRHGPRRASYEKLKAVSGYEDVPELKKARTATLEKRWIDLVDAARDCATDDPITPQLNCVYLHPTKKHLEVLASNTRVIFQGTTASEKSITQSIAFPLMLVDSLRLDNATKLHWTDKIALVEFPKGKIWQGVKTAARKNFPVESMRKMMAEAVQDRAILAVNAALLSDTALRIAAYVAALSKEALIFSIRLTKGSRNVYIESGADSSKFQETLKIMEPAKEDILIEWPLDQVMPALIYIKDDGIAKIRLSKDGRSCLTTKTVSLLVAKPLKPKKVEKKKKDK